jgi:hypothetical protein
MMCVLVEHTDKNHPDGIWYGKVVNVHRELDGSLVYHIYFTGDGGNLTPTYCRRADFVSQMTSLCANLCSRPGWLYFLLTKLCLQKRNRKGI